MRRYPIDTTLETITQNNHITLKRSIWIHLIQYKLYKIYYKNVKNILPEYFQIFTPAYNTAADHNHDLGHTTLGLPMTKREYYVQCTKYQYLK